MEINRNQWFLAGIILLLLGIQFRVVDGVVLNDKLTARLASRMGPAERTATSLERFIPNFDPTVPRRTIRPPEWLGYALLSIGAVLILHSLAMPKPEG